MTAQSIVGFCGYKNHGKDTAARFLIEQFGYEKIAFADPLKIVCKLLFGLTDEELNDPSWKEQPLERWPFETPRKIMQKTGTEAMRRVYPDIWIKAWERAIEGKPRVVVTDFRFPNEAEVLTAHGALRLRVHHPHRAFDDAHESERHVENLPVDAILSNSGTIEELWQQVRYFVSRLGDFQLRAALAMAPSLHKEASFEPGL